FRWKIRDQLLGRCLVRASDRCGYVQVFHTDALGSVRAITDISGTLKTTYLTDEFGVLVASQGAGVQAYGVISFGFTGEPQDPGSQLEYLRARYSAPVLGRFLSRDAVFGSVANPLSLNRYSYVQNNPATYADPSGHCGPFMPLCIAAGIVAADGGLTIE